MNSTDIDMHADTVTEDSLHILTLSKMAQSLVIRKFQIINRKFRQVMLLFSF